MLTTTLLRRHTPSIRALSLATALRRCPLAGSRPLRPQCLHAFRQRMLISSSTPTQAKSSSKSTYVYPEMLRLYLAPTFQTVTIGITRLVTVVVFFTGTLAYLPNLYADETTPTWMIPAAFLACGAPFAAAVLSGPFITSIRAALPNSARRSPEELRRFTTNTPPNTRLRLQFIRFAPWLVTRDVIFSDLRRLPRSRWRLSNLEHVPPEKQKAIEKAGATGTVVSRYFARYWVNMASTTFKERGEMKGAWGKVWEQIPAAGAKEEVRVAGTEEKRTVLRMNNRGPAVQSSALPPPPPPLPLRKPARVGRK